MDSNPDSGEVEKNIPDDPHAKLADKHKKRTKLRSLKLVTAALFFIALGGLSINVGQPGELARCVFLSSLTIAIILTIVIISASMVTASLLRKICSTIIIAFMIAVFLFFAPFMLRSISSFLYTAPAITPERFKIFTSCVEFLKKHDEYGNFTLYREQGLNFASVNTDTYWALDESRFDRKKPPPFTSDHITEMKFLLQQLSAVDCAKIQRSDNVILFYTATNGLIVRPGVLYSIQGNNPNQINNSPVNENKPFIKIYENWYLSKHLILKQNRWAINPPVPESLIDHSLKIDNLDLEDFDTNLVNY